MDYTIALDKYGNKKPYIVPIGAGGSNDYDKLINRPFDKDHKDLEIIIDGKVPETRYGANQTQTGILSDGTMLSLISKSTQNNIQSAILITPDTANLESDRTSLDENSIMTKRDCDRGFVGMDNQAEEMTMGELLQGNGIKIKLENGKVTLTATINGITTEFQPVP